MPAFDTRQVAKELETAFSPEQAELIVKVFARTLVEDLATKSDVSDSEHALRQDIERLETTLRADIKAFETKVESDIKSLKIEIRSLEAKIDAESLRIETKIETSIADLKAEMVNLKAEMIKWMVGVLAFNLFGTAGLVITLIKVIPR